MHQIFKLIKNTNSPFLPLCQRGRKGELTVFIPLHLKASFFGRKLNNVLNKLSQINGLIRNGLTDVTGFTLIELMVVILIVGIMGIIAAPNMRSWYTGFQVRSCADSITNTLVTARMNAIKNGNNVVVAFYTAGNCPKTVAGIGTNVPAGTSCYFIINDADNDCQLLADVSGGGCIQAGEFNGVVNTCSSSIVFPAAIVPKPGAGFTVTTTYCAVTGINTTPCVIPNACTFCTGNVGAVAFLPSGYAQFLSAGGPNGGGNMLGGSVTVIPSMDVTNNDSSKEYAVGIISLTGAVKEFY